MGVSIHAVLAVSSILFAYQSSAAPNLNATTRIDCYSDVPGFKNNGTWTWQTDGYCQIQCVGMGYPVMALYAGDECLCGDEIPPDATKTTGCDAKCSGYPEHLCGGKNAYEVFLTGTTPTVAVMDQQSADTTTTSSAGITVITQAGQTIVVTASSTPSSSASSGGGVNTAGVAAGVVIGVVALCAIIGAVFFFLRRRKAKQFEEEYRRNAEINAFAQKGPATPNDSRWDGDYMAQRRQSNGSIDDDQDFSRRILTVTNPDGRGRF